MRLRCGSLWSSVVIWIALATTGCGSRCAEIAARKHALLERAAGAAGPHAQVRISFARANQLIAALVHDQPIRVPIELPSLGPFALPVRALTALARDVELRPAPPDRVRFAVRVEIRDVEQPVTTLAIEVEVTPELVRAGDASELVAGFGPESLRSVKPELGEATGHALVDAVARWLPPSIRDRLPRTVLDRAAEQLGAYLTGEAYQLLRTTLLQRLGELTRVRLRLPALPIAKTAIASTADAMTIDLTTDLPVRRSLAARAPASDGLTARGSDGLTVRAPGSDGLTVRIAASTAAELANWSIARGWLPQHYTRELAPRTDGAYRPIFDYVAEDAHRPAKLHIFQDRGGCSYFQVGLRLEVQIVDDKLEVATLDRLVESASASAPLELGLWLKQLIQGSVDRSYRAAAHTRLTIGGRQLVSRVIRAAVVGDDLALELAATPHVAVPPSTVP